VRRIDDPLVGLEAVPLADRLLRARRCRGCRPRLRYAACRRPGVIFWPSCWRQPACARAPCAGAWRPAAAAMACLMATALGSIGAWRQPACAPCRAASGLAWALAHRLGSRHGLLGGDDFLVWSTLAAPASTDAWPAPWRLPLRAQTWPAKACARSACAPRPAGWLLRRTLTRGLLPCHVARLTSYFRLHTSALRTLLFLLAPGAHC
jgi:hypothetical protein